MDSSSHGSVRAGHHERAAVAGHAHGEAVGKAASKAPGMAVGKALGTPPGGKAADKALWWNTGMDTSRPKAVFFYHIVKCAGASVTYWLLRHNQDFGLKLPYSQAPLILSMYESVLPRHNITSKLGRSFRVRWDPSVHGPLPDWRRTSVAVEFHYTAAPLFWQLEPHFPTLRRLYREAGGRFVTFTTVRDPMSMIKSFYRWRGPRAPSIAGNIGSAGNAGSAGKAGDSGSTEGGEGQGEVRLKPFSQFLQERRADGLITRELNIVVNPLGGITCTPSATRMALQRLHAFDLIGEAEDPTRVLHAVGRCVELRNYSSRTVPHIHETGRWEAESAGQVANLSQSVRARLEEAAACDAEVYQGAVNLGETLPTNGPCAMMQYE